MLDLDAVLLLGAALTIAPLLTRAPAAVLAVAIVAVLVARRRGLGAVLVALGLLTGAWRAERTCAAHAERVAELAKILPRPARCTGRGTVSESPVLVRGVGRLVVDFTSLACEGAEAPPLRAVVYEEESEGLARGDEVTLTTTLAPLERFADVELGPSALRRARARVTRSGGALDLRRVAKGHGLLAAIDRARTRVRRRIQATFPPDTAPLARALVLGETDLDPRDDAAFRTSGLSHLLAVSGMHLVLVVLGFVRVLAALLARITQLAARFDTGRGAAALGVMGSWVYADFAGGSGSALRAAWMLTFLLAARVLGRRSDASRCFGLSLVAMTLVDPLVVADLSFVLSAAATLGLLVLARPLTRGLLACVPGALRFLAESVATTTAATVPCAPVLLCFAPTVPLGSVVANLLAVPLGESAALPVCILHALLAPWPHAEAGAARVASGALTLVRGIARFFADLRMLSLPVPPPSAFELAILACGALLVGALRGRARAVVLLGSLLALSATEVQVRREARPLGELRVTFLDVGQGDAALVDLPDGGAVLLDAGGLVGSPVDVGERVIGPVLRARRRTRLAAAILSHPHPDHFGGFGAGLSGAHVDELWDTGQGAREGVSGGYARLLDHARDDGALVLGPEALCGAPRTLGGARFEVLAPCPAASPDRGPNDNSLVVRVTFGARSFLFVGDAEHEEEADLLRLPLGALRADVLKVGHHGSRTSSSPAFVAAVAPSEAVISAGVRNRFGHPTAETLDTLAAAGVRVHRTDREGEILARTDGRALSITAPAADDL